MNIGNSLKEKMVEQAERFGKWTSLVTDVLKNSQGLKNDVSALNELDTALEDLKMVNEQVIAEQKSGDFTKTIEVIQVDLTKIDIDLSEWDGDVKPIKVFLTLNKRDDCKPFEIVLEIGDMMFLMEDGTFRKRLLNYHMAINQTKE